MALTLRSVIGVPLTYDQLDGNFLYLQSLTGLTIVPSLSNTYQLGSNLFTWNELFLGTGGLVMTDSITSPSTQYNFTVTNGVLSLDTINSIAIGDMLYGSSGIYNVIPGEDINIGSAGATGYAFVQGAGIKFPDNTIQITASTAGSSGSSGLTGTSGTAGSSGTSFLGVTSGSAGSSGTSGADGVPGTSGTSGNTGANGISGSAGSSGTSAVGVTSGSSGNSGSAGSSGLMGTSGSSGITGSSGSSGVSATSFTNVITPGSFPYTLNIDFSTAQAQAFRINYSTAGTVTAGLSNFTAGNTAIIYVFPAASGNTIFQPECNEVIYSSSNGTFMTWHYTESDPSLNLKTLNGNPMVIEYTCVDNTSTNLICLALGVNTVS